MARAMTTLNISPGHVADNPGDGEGEGEGDGEGDGDGDSSSN